LERKLNPGDARSQMIGLTQSGQALFERVFPAHLSHLNKAFQKMSSQQLQDLQESLNLLKSIF
jgi:DNA-binding MarR family transcriptional regulator